MASIAEDLLSCSDALSNSACTGLEHGMRHRVELDCLLLKNREGQRDDSLCGIVDDSLAAKIGMNSDVTGSPLDLLDRGG